MNPKKFKVLTYLGNYVDERLLPKGLIGYKPHLQDLEKAISVLQNCG